MLITIVILLGIILVAAICFYALYRSRDVKFNAKFLGANVSLETRGGRVGRRER